MHDAHITLSAHDARRVAVVAGCDPRSVLAYLDPERRAKMKSTTAARVKAALEALGLAARRVA